MSKYPISVIVPVFNVEPYINQCIESITNQSFTDFELILVDDGSTDNSGAIIDEYAKKDTRITAIHQINSGLSAARNAGYKVSQGEYIMFIDSDDYIDLHMIEKLYTAIKKENAQMSICYEIPFMDNTTPIPHAAPITENKCENHNEFMAHFMDDFRGPLTWAWNKLIERSLMDGIPFQEGRIVEDLLFITDLSHRIQRVVWIPERLYYYRQRETSIMHTYFEKRYLDYLYGINYEYDLLKYYEKNEAFHIRHGIKCAGSIHQIYKEAKLSKNTSLVSAAKDYYCKLYTKIDWSNAPIHKRIKYSLIYIRIKNTKDSTS